MKDPFATIEHLKQAKDALIHACYSAERDLSSTDEKLISDLIDRLEAVQNKIALHAT